MSGSVSFDRAAGYYDGTRSLTPEAQQAVTDLLAGELSGTGPTLEIGVGTGRIALPLHRAGTRITGIDLSRPMIDVLRVCHVFHLIPTWTDAAAELIRVIRPGGRVCLEVGNWGHDGWKLLQEHLAEEAGIPKRFTYSQLLDSFASGQWSWTWAAGAAVLRDAGERTRVWAAAEFGDLDEEREHVLETSWRAYDLP
ncbi:MAG: class I SAM-dependent methyltransferase [Actinobacteria bacterium]|nr:class I SAM-dependent methyltransferase [Actinomycetota bacterium]